MVLSGDHDSLHNLAALTFVVLRQRREETAERQKEGKRGRKREKEKKTKRKGETETGKQRLVRKRGRKWDAKLKETE